MKMKMEMESRTKGKSMKRLSYGYASLMAAALIGVGLMTVAMKATAAACSDTITGGGWIYPDDTTTANFGVSGGLIGGELWVPGSSLNYLDDAADIHVVSTAIVDYRVENE